MCKLQLKSFMFKHLLLATILFLTKTFLFGQISKDDYRVYAAIIKTEISDSTKSVAIIKSGIDSQETVENTYMTANNLTSKDLSYKYQTYNLFTQILLLTGASNTPHTSSHLDSFIIIYSLF